MKHIRLTDEERQALFDDALETEHGQTLKTLFWSVAVLLEDNRHLHDAIADGVIDSPDGGFAMASARWPDLGEDEQRKVNEDVRTVLRRTMAESLAQLEDASGRLGADPHEIHPVTVALLAASTLVIYGHRYEGDPY
jgi:hypothetical protein